MAELARTGVSIDEDLLLEFDRLIAKRGYKNRSEAFRDLIREALLTETVDSNKPVVGTLTLVYDHHRPHLVEKLLALQHDHSRDVVSSMHVHLDHDRCLEVLVLRGTGAALRKLAESLRGLKGVHVGALTLAETEESPVHSARSHSHPH